MYYYLFHIHCFNFLFWDDCRFIHICKKSSEEILYILPPGSPSSNILHSYNCVTTRKLTLIQSTDLFFFSEFTSFACIHFCVYSVSHSFITCVELWPHCSQAIEQFPSQRSLRLHFYRHSYLPPATPPTYYIFYCPFVLWRYGDFAYFVHHWISTRGPCTS